MKRLSFILIGTVSLMFILCFTIIGKEKIQYAIARFFYHKNYISVQSSPGKVLWQPQFKPGDILDISIDGKMKEETWGKSQLVNRFFTQGRTPDDDVVVNVLSDKEWANRALRCFQSQGIHFVRHTPLHLVKSYVEVPEEENSIFDGL